MGANEKHAATYHGREYTPRLSHVRAAYAHTTSGAVGLAEAEAQFARWLDKIRAEAKAEALTEMAKLIESKAKILDPEDPTQRGARIGLITAGADLTFRANQYKENQS